MQNDHPQSANRDALLAFYQHGRVRDSRDQATVEIEFHGSQRSFKFVGTIHLSVQGYPDSRIDILSPAFPESELIHTQFRTGYREWAFSSVDGALTIAGQSGKVGRYFVVMKPS